MIKRAVVESLLTAKLRYTSSTQLALPPVIRKSISYLLSIGPETHATICDWLTEGCQCHSSHCEPSAPAVSGHFEPMSLTRSMCENYSFFAELCKYLAFDNEDTEKSIRSILNSVISESAALATLLS
jgi:hypothetical protein